MSVKVAIPRDIESSFNSSIAMPDSAMGEAEWQNEGERFYSINAENQQVSIFPNDSIYVSRDSADISSDVFLSVSKSGSESLIVSRFSSSGGFIASSTQSISRPATWHIGGISKVGRVLVIPIYTYDNESWEVEFIAYDLKLNIFGDFSAGTNFSPDLSDFGSSSRFNIKAGVGTVAVMPKDFTGQILVFNYSGSLIATSRVSGAIDFFVDEGVGFYILLGNSGFNDKVEVLITDSALNVSRSISVKLIGASSTSSARINYDGLNVSLVTLKSTGVMAFVYDKNMINIGSYKRNNEVIKSSTKRKYRCAVDATFEDPEIGVNLSPPTWVDVGSTNKYAILDSNTSQRSIFNGGGFASRSITSPVDTVGVFGLSGVQSATVSVVSGSSTLYAETKSGMDSEFSDVEIRDLVFSIPPFSNVTIRVDFTGSNVRVGRFAVGVSETIGRAVPGTELGDIDYSILEFDEFGNTRYIPRPIVSFHTFQVDVAKQKSLSVARKLQSIGGKDAIWSADVGLSEPLVAIGKCERFPITYDNPTIVSYTVKVRGTA